VQEHNECVHDSHSASIRIQTTPSVTISIVLSIPAFDTIVSLAPNSDTAITVHLGLLVHSAYFVKYSAHALGQLAAVSHN
jgi:hypothetical protein